MPRALVGFSRGQAVGAALGLAVSLPAVGVACAAGGARSRARVEPPRSTLGSTWTRSSASSSSCRSRSSSPRASPAPQHGAAMPGVTVSATASAPTSSTIGSTWTPGSTSAAPLADRTQRRDGHRGDGGDHDGRDADGQAADQCRTDRQAPGDADGPQRRPVAPLSPALARQRLRHEGRDHDGHDDAEGGDGLGLVADRVARRFDLVVAERGQEVEVSTGNASWTASAAVGQHRPRRHR